MSAPAKLAGVEFSPVQVVAIDDLQPASYNPRQVFPDRLKLVRLSIEKLGWLLPIYADPHGEILSGHQRHHVAAEMGATHVPVVYTRALNTRQRRGLNIVFSRITNDLAKDDHDAALTDQLKRSPVPRAARKLPTIPFDHPDHLRVCHATPVDLGWLLDRNPLWMDPHAIGLTGDMRNMGTSVMPIVITPEGRIINGRARAMAAALAGLPTLPAVRIPEEIAEIAEGLLNLLSMKYDLEGTLADDLRTNAHRAAPSVRHTMSVNSTYDLLRAERGDSRPPLRWFDFTRTDHQEAWLAFYGPNVCDLGAGHYADARHMVQMGASVTAFEPFFEYDPDATRRMAREWFFPGVADGREFSTIFLSNVINSVPFEEDRRHLVVLAASLAGPDTLLCASTRGTGELRGNRASTSARNAQLARTLEANYERNTVVTNLNVRPLAQKFHDYEEFAELWRTGFAAVWTTRVGNQAFARARNPLPVTADQVRAAIEFEFDLPHETERLGLVDEALAAWRSRGWDV